MTPAQFFVPRLCAPGAFRLFLAMLVFVHHFSAFHLGTGAVYVFFVLSGFWLNSMWIGRYRHTRQAYFTYMVSRIWRLAPAMVLISAITIAGLQLLHLAPAAMFARPAHLAFSTAFLLGYAWLPYLPVGSAWSLDVEMQFYLVAPLLCVLFARGRAWILVAAAAIISLATLWFVASIDLHRPVEVLPKYLLFFALGVAASTTGWRPSRGSALGSAISVPILLALITLSPMRGILWGGATPGALFVWNPALNIVAALLWTPFALFTVRQPSDPVDQAMADLSYIIYLAHWLAMQWFFTFAGHPFSQRLLVAASCFAAVPMFSVGFWVAVDRPINMMRRRWVAARKLDRNEAFPPVLSEPAGP